MKAPKQKPRSRRPEVRRILSYIIHLTSYILLFFFSFCSPSQAGEERIAGLSATVVRNDEIRVSARLIRWMNPKLQEDIQNGIPKDLFYTIVLKKRIPGWFDEEMSSETIKHTIKYDVLKKQYLITTHEDQDTAQRVAETEQEMTDLISEINNVKMTLAKNLKTRHTYYVSVKAEMKASRLPFFLDYILFFIPVPELDTPWANSAPFYAIEASP